MKRILIIEDDRLIGDVYRGKLRTEGFAVDLARDGTSGLEMFHNHRPDLVLLDLMLPGMSGIEVLKNIRSDAARGEVPVLVFSNAYLGAMVEEAWESGATEVLTKANHPPGQVVEAIKTILAATPAAPATQQSESDNGARSEAEHQTDLRKTFLDTAPKTLTVMRQLLKTVAERPTDAAVLEDLYQHVRSLAAKASMAGLDHIAQLAGAVEALVKKLTEKRERVGPSTLRTIAQAMDMFATLFDQRSQIAGRNPSEASVLVVDDDEFSRQAVCGALKSAGLRATCADSALAAMLRLTERRYNLIFLDVELPDINGFEFCSRLRLQSNQPNAVVIFVTMSNNLEARAQSALSGADDYITKPFPYTELAVKALVWLMKGHTEVVRPSVPVGSKNSSVPDFLG